MLLSKSFNSLLLILLINLSFAVNYNTAISKESNYQKLKNQSYEVIAEALYNKNTYSKFKLEMIEMLGNLSDPSGQSYSDESFNKSPIYRLIKSMMTIVTANMNKKRANSLNQEDYAIEGKVKSIVDKGDASIAYMLKDALSFPDYTIQLYAATALMQVKEESASPMFMEMLEKDKNQDKIVALNVLGDLKYQEAFDKIVDIALDKKIPSKTRITAIRALEKIDPEKKVVVSKKLMFDPEEDVMQESIAFLASKNDSEGVKKYKELLKNSYSKKKAILSLSKVVEGLQQDSLEIVELASQGDKLYDKIMALDSYKNLNDKSSVLDILNEAFNQDNPQLKVKAFEVLMDVDDKEVKENIAGLTLENPEFYSEPVKYIIAKNDKKYDCLLKSIVEKSSPKVKIVVSEYLFNNNREEDFVKEILMGLFDDENQDIKEVAAIILLDNGYEEGFEIVKESFKSDKSKLRAKIIVSLALYGDKEVIPYLEDSIKNNNDVNKTFGAALLLSSLGEMDYLDIVEKYLAQEKIAGIDKKFVHLDLFKELLTHYDPMVRLNAAITLYDSGNISTMDKIIGLLDSKDIKVRAKAAKFIGENADKKVINKLQNLLDDEFVRVRVNASEALLRIINREDLVARS